MEQKKSPQANLEKQKSTFFQIGLVISLVLILLAFECTRPIGELITLVDNTKSEIDEDFKTITWRKEKPEPKVKIIKLKDVIVIFADDVELDDELQLDDTEADQNTVVINYNLPDEDIDLNDEIFIIVEEMPEFPGGDNALLNFLNKNVKYPIIAIENNIQGTVYVSFVISKKGFVENVQILRGVDPILDQAALEVVKKLPKWNPGLQRGKAVNVAYRVPIKFKLN